MSPQLSLHEAPHEHELVDDCSTSCSRRISYTNSQLTKAVDVTFSFRQDRGLESPDDLVRTCNPLIGDTQRMHLRKRKCNFNERNFPAQINTDFLSGIFQDLAEVRTDVISQGDCSVTYSLESTEEPYTSELSSPTNDFRPTKKSRISMSLSRCSKSFLQLQQCSVRQTDSNTSDRGSSSFSTNDEIQTAFPDDSSNDVHPVSADSTAARMVDHIFSNSITNINFPVLPTLPATVSESSCNSNNLTQTAVQAAQVLETQKLIHVEGTHANETNKNGYGFFVEMDEEDVNKRLQDVAAASESCRAIATPEDSSLTFSARCPKKAVALDSEVEWAKAADTVDDVLGGILF